MATVFTLAATTAAQGALGAAIDVNNWNGNLGNVDISKPVDFVDEASKWVLTAAGGISLTRTIRKILRDQVAVGVAVNQAAIDAAIPIIGRKVAAYELMSLAAKSGIAINFRNSDCVDDATAQVDEGKENPNVDVTAQGVEAMIEGNEIARAEALAESHLVLYALIANAIHREKNAGHSWFTADTNKRGTDAYKACKVGGKYTNDLRAFMAECGHDMWHLLTDDTMNDVVNGFTGTVVVVIAQAINYNGIAVQGMNLHDVVGLADSAVDRWPVGVLGKSALVLGVRNIYFMLNMICSKTVVEDAKEIEAAIDDAAHEINTRLPNRAAVLRAKDHYANAIAIAYGFGTAFPDVAEELEAHPSLVKYIGDYPSIVASGKALGKIVKSMEPAEEVLEASIHSALAILAASL